MIKPVNHIDVSTAFDKPFNDSVATFTGSKVPDNEWGSCKLIGYSVVNQRSQAVQLII